MEGQPHRALTLALLSTVAACLVPNTPGSHSTAGDEAPSAGELGTGDAPLLDANDDHCQPPPQVSCDDAEQTDPLQVVGLDCPNGIPAVGGTDAQPGAIAIFDGPLGPYEALEGDNFLVMSTGLAAHLSLTPEQLTQVCDDLLACPNTNHGAGPTSLPEPLDVTPVGSEQSCLDDPQLVGTGDCSNTLADQCGGGCQVWDAAQLSVSLTVPAGVCGLAFSFAFLTAEYPLFTGGSYNDMFVGWLESETWTGNVSFDRYGHPITVNAAVPDYTVDELAGTAMQGHAGTRWLTTNFGVSPGDTLGLTLVVLDLGDGSYDSAVLLDNFRWTSFDLPPQTSLEP